MEHLIVGALAFASTNVDDILLLAVWFAQPRRRVFAIVAGQYLGIGILVIVSAAVALTTMVIPREWIPVTGGVPLVLGIRHLLTRGQGLRLERSQASWHLLEVAAVTIANGGDNVGVYVPLFASQPAALATDAVVFAIGTALWCALGHWLVAHPATTSTIERNGHLALPWVLIGIGLYLIAGAARGF
jgi:cadmium resistance protein CadD (predicted permease)